jgi:hypothetical protein
MNELIGLYLFNIHISQVECPPELAGALVPLLFLILTVDGKIS